MTRWNASVTLVSRNKVQSEDGSWQDGEPVETTVYANRRKVGSSTWLAAMSAGLHADASVEVRSFEYDGQDVAILDGIEYTVEKAQSTGEFTTLTLARRLSNG
jgi:hypothetical protein